jgi:hypothetical protein
MKSTNSLATRSPRGVALARILPANAGALHPSKLRTRLSAPSNWKRSRWTSEVMATTAAESEGVRMQRGAERSKAKGRNDQRKCKSVTTARGVNPFSRQTLPLAPRDATGNLTRRAPKSEPPPTFVRLSISAGNNGPVYDMGGQAHKSYSLGVGSLVQKEQIAACTSTAPPRDR